MQFALRPIAKAGKGVLASLLCLWVGAQAHAANQGTWEVLSLAHDPASVYQPMGVAIGTGGEIYVADTGHHRVLVRDAAGEWKVLAPLGQGLGQVRAPEGVAVDGSGGLYVADTGNDRIQRRTPSGQWELMASPGSGGGQVKAPRALTCDQSGDLFVADRGNNRLLQRTSTGAWSMVAQDGGGLGQVLGPRGIAVDSLGNLYATDDGYGSPRLQRRDARGYWDLLDIQTPGSPSSHITDPRGLALDAEDNLYICDGESWKILVRTPGGLWSAITGGIHDTTAIAISEGTGLVITEARSSRVVQRSSLGKWTPLASKTYVPGQLRLPRSLALDSRGTLFVTQDDYYRFDSRSASGDWSLASAEAPDVLASQHPYNVVADSSGNLYLSCSSDAFLKRAAVDGRWQRVPIPEGMPFDYGYELAVGTGGELYFGRTEVGSLTPQGQWVSIAPNGDGLGKVRAVTGLAMDRAGTLYVSEFGGGKATLQARGPLGEWRYLASFHDPRSPVTSPEGIAVDGAGNLYVSDWGTNRILVHTGSGVWFQLAGAGADPGQVWKPWGLALDREGNLYVADSGNNRVQRFRPPLVAQVGDASCQTRSSGTTVTLPIELLPSGHGVFTRVELRLTSSSASFGVLRDPRFSLPDGTQGWSLQLDPSDPWHVTLIRSVEGAAPPSLSLLLVTPRGVPAGAVFTVAATDALASFEAGLKFQGSAQVGSGSVRVLDYVPGDATGDGAVTIEDVALVLRMCLLLEDPSYAYARQAADVNGSGAVSIADALLLLRAVLDGRPLSGGS